MKQVVGRVVGVEVWGGVGCIGCTECMGWVHRGSGVGWDVHPPTTIHPPLLTTSPQPLVTNHQPPHHLPPNTSRQPPTTNQQQPPTTNTPHTTHPTPQAPHHTPHTIHYPHTTNHQLPTTDPPNTTYVLLTTHLPIPPLTPGDLSSLKGMLALTKLDLRSCSLITGTVAVWAHGRVDGGS